MNIERLRLTKEEVLVSLVGSSDVTLYVPIHPKLLLPETKIDPEIPDRSFERAAAEWYDDLEALAQSGNYPSEQVKWWREVFLRKRPTVKNSKYGKKVMSPIHWENEYMLDDNGFMSCFSISRDGGGTLYFHKDNGGHEFSGYLFPGRLGRTSLRINDTGKAKEFSIETCDSVGGEFFRTHVYACHNVDFIPGAVMLRNWALAYMDEALKVVAD